MKWKLYLLSCFYNLTVSSCITLYGLYHDLRDVRFDPFALVIYSGLIACFIKNLMGYRARTAYVNHQIVSKRFTGFFYVLWAINLVYTIVMLVAAYQLITSSYMVQRNWMDFMLLVLFFGMSFVSSYTLILDIAAIRNASRLPDLAADLLADYNETKV